MDRRVTPVVLTEEKVRAQAQSRTQAPGDADRVERQSVAKVEDEGQADDRQTGTQQAPTRRAGAGSAPSASRSA